MTFLRFIPLIIFGSTLLFLSSCAKEEPAPEKELAVLFVDKSTSTTPDDFIRSKEQKWLRDICAKHRSVGTTFVVSYLFANTANVTNKHVIPYDPPKPKTKLSANNQKQLAKIKYEKRLRRYDQRFMTQLQEKVFSSAKLPSGSNIVGSLKQISDLMTDFPGHKVSVYYFSDMQECSDFRAMYCQDGKPPNSYEEMQKLAQEDFQRLGKKYQLADSFLSKVNEIEVIFSAREMDQSDAFELVPVYWKSLLASFGASSPNKVKFH